MFTVPAPPKPPQSNSATTVGGLTLALNGAALNQQAQQMMTPDKTKRTKPKIRWSSKEHRETMRKAVEAVLVNGNTTKVATRFNIPARTLRRYVAKEKKRREAGATSLFDTMKNDSGRSRNINIPGPRKLKKNVQLTKKNTIGRERTASVDFVMKHIHGADPSSFSDMFSKDIILSFGEAAASGRLRAMSTNMRRLRHENMIQYTIV